MQMVDPIARGNAADTANGCQMMSNSYVEKDLIRNEHCMIAYIYILFSISNFWFWMNFWMKGCVA